MAFVRLRRRRLGVTLDLVASSRTAAGPRQRFVACLGTLRLPRGSARDLLDRARDRLASLSIPPTERASAARSLCTALRRLGATVAHQHEVALAHHAADPRPRLASLRGCSVGPVDPGEARALITVHEWLGTIGNARIFFSLRAPGGDLLAVVGFGHGPHAGGQGGALVLERGLTLLHAPANAATHLIGRALRLLRKMGWRAFRPYTDPAAGETGSIYRALGWRPVVTRHGKPWRYALIEAGRALSDRAIYRRFGSHAAARAGGAQIIRAPARIAWSPAGGQ